MTTGRSCARVGSSGALPAQYHEKWRAQMRRNARQDRLRVRTGSWPHPAWAALIDWKQCASFTRCLNPARTLVEPTAILFGDPRGERV
jgi:hypothetical protein